MSENLPAVRPVVRAGGSVAALVPQSIDEAWRLSEAFAKGKILPRGITEPAQVMLIICGGAEVGFGPFQSLQSFYLVNNRLTLWGDAIPALLWSNGFKLKEWFENASPDYPDDMVAKCIVTRPDGQEIEGEFTVADAKEGKLWSKDGPWQTARKRMLKMRARAFTARDGAPDVLRGVAIREEVEDYDIVTEIKTAPQALHAGFEDPQKDGRKPRTPRQRPADPAPAVDVLAGDDLPATVKGPTAEEIATANAALDAATEEVDTIAEGFPEVDEVYHLDGDEWDAETGRRDTYKNGTPFSTATRKAEHAIYADHAGVLGSEEKTAAVENEGQDEEALPPEFAAFINNVEDARDFPAVKAALKTLQGGAYWKTVTDDQSNRIRCNTWETMVDNFAPEALPDPAKDVSAFRLWVEAQEDPDTITSTLSALENDPEFKPKPEPMKEQIRGAAAARIKALEP